MPRPIVWTTFSFAYGIATAANGNRYNCGPLPRVPSILCKGDGTRRSDREQLLKELSHRAGVLLVVEERYVVSTAKKRLHSLVLQTCRKSAGGIEYCKTTASSPSVSGLVPIRHSPKRKNTSLFTDRSRYENRGAYKYTCFFFLFRFFLSFCCIYKEKA